MVFAYFKYFLGDLTLSTKNTRKRELISKSKAEVLKIFSKHRLMNKLQIKYTSTSLALKNWLRPVKLG